MPNQRCWVLKCLTLQCLVLAYVSFLPSIFLFLMQNLAHPENGQVLGLARFGIAFDSHILWILKTECRQECKPFFQKKKKKNVSRQTASRVRCVYTAQIENLKRALLVHRKNNKFCAWHVSQTKRLQGKYLVFWSGRRLVFEVTCWHFYVFFWCLCIRCFLRMQLSQKNKCASDAAGFSSDINHCVASCSSVTVTRRRKQKLTLQKWKSNFSTSQPKVYLSWKKSSW